MIRPYFLLLYFLLGSQMPGITQVDLYLFHPEFKSFRLGNIQNVYVYNRAGVPIDGILDVQIKDASAELVYHIQTRNATLPPGKTQMAPYYRQQEVLIDQLPDKSVSLSAHTVQIQLLHPLDKSSIITRYTFDTQRCGAENGYSSDRNRNFYIRPYSFEGFSRESKFAKEGIELTYELRLPNGLERPLAEDEVSLDIRNSRLLSLTDNSGKDYLREQAFAERQHRDYLRAQARQGKFIVNMEPYGGILPGKNVFRPEGLLFFRTRLLSLPQLATNLHAEGYISFYEHTDQLVERTVKVRLEEGHFFELDGHQVQMVINGASFCNNQQYELLSLQTALKIKGLHYADPSQNPCGDYGPDTHLKVDKGQLPFETELTIVYHEPILRHEYFSNNFNLNLLPKAPPVKTDQYYEFGITRLQVNQAPNRAGHRLEVDYPFVLPEGARYLSRKSSVQLFSPTSQPIKMGKVGIKETFGGDGDGLITLVSDQLPSQAYPYLIADIKIHVQKDSKDTESFTFEVQSPEAQPTVFIDDYPIQLFSYDGGFSFLVQEGNHTSSGNIPGRTLIDAVVQSEKGQQTLQPNGSRFALETMSYPMRITIRTYRPRVAYRQLKKKVAFGAIHNMNQSNQPRQATAPNNVPSRAPISTPAPKTEDIDAPVRRADTQPLFPGCEEYDQDHGMQIQCSIQSITEYIYQHPTYLAHKKTGKQSIILKFVVEKDGSLSGFKVMRSYSPEWSEAAVQIMKEKDKDWTPATIDGAPVRFSYVLPIKF